MKFYDSARLKHLLILLLFGIVFVPLVTWGLGTVSTGFQTTTLPKKVIAHDICKKVSHNGGISYFIPTKTSIEWNLFINNHPADVSISNCKDCLGAGGAWVDANGFYICRFDASSCPSGWTQYLNWSTTQGGGPNTYDCTPLPYGNSICSTSGDTMTTGHSWMNHVREKATKHYQFEGGGIASTCGDSSGSQTCYAKITQIGCY